METRLGIIEQKTGDNGSRAYKGDNAQWASETRIFGAIESGKNDPENLDKLMGEKYAKSTKGLVQVDEKIQMKLRQENSGEMASTFKIGGVIEQTGNISRIVNYDVSVQRFDFDGGTSVVLLAVDKFEGYGVATNFNAHDPLTLDLNENEKPALEVVPFTRKNSHHGKFLHQETRVYFISKPVATPLLPRLVTGIQEKFEKGLEGRRKINMDRKTTERLSAEH